MLATMAYAQPAWEENPLQMGYMEFPIANVDNVFIPYSNPSLLGTGAATGIGLAHLNDDEVWKRHYWLLLNTEGLSYAYERDEGISYHLVATGFELFPAYVFPNVYAGVNYRWCEDKYKDGVFRSGVTYRPLDATSVAFTWDNPIHGKPYYRGGLAVRPLALSTFNSRSSFGAFPGYELCQVCCGRQIRNQGSGVGNSNSIAEWREDWGYL